MSKNKKKTKSVPRNSNVMSARSRVAGMAPMKSKNAPRGGNKNEQRELLEENDLKESDLIDLAFEIANVINADGITGFDKWLVEQMKDPEFKKDYETAMRTVKAPGLLSHLTDEQKKRVFGSDVGDTGGGIDDDDDEF